MKTEFEKTMLIASELLSYCHLKGAAEFHLDVAIENSVTTFFIKASPAILTDEEFTRITKKLNIHRQHEIEQGFWGLSGESETTSELVLVGMMSDEAAVRYEGDTLSITLTRRL